MSEEEKIRRAELIAERRNNRIPASSINNRSKRRMTTFTKISIQIITSICIFGLCYFLHQNNSYALEVIKPVISSDTDFQKLYSNINDAIKNFDIEEKSKENNLQQEIKQNEEQSESIDNKVASETLKDISSTEENKDFQEPENDVTYIKRNASFIKPIEGVITSKYGERVSTDIISANHEGVDIGADEGIEIKASMEGIAEIVSEEGEYGKHIKITNGEISTIYGHCSELLITQGEKIEQGKIIAKVGNTGKSTGPHLHFEIRRNNNPVNPEEIFEL